MFDYGWVQGGSPPGAELATPALTVIFNLYSKVKIYIYIFPMITHRETPGSCF